MWIQICLKRGLKEQRLKNDISCGCKHVTVLCLCYWPRVTSIRCLYYSILQVWDWTKKSMTQLIDGLDVCVFLSVHWPSDLLFHFCFVLPSELWPMINFVTSFQHFCHRCVKYNFLDVVWHFTDISVRTINKSQSGEKAKRKEDKEEARERKVFSSFLSVGTRAVMRKQVNSCLVPRAGGLIGSLENWEPG